MDKSYKIFLDGSEIGITKLEKADYPMGVLIGEIEFKGIDSAYRFFKDYSIENNIILTLDDPEHKAIATMAIDSLKVIRQDGSEIKGLGNLIQGIEREYYEIHILGYPHMDEFPHLLEKYIKQFE